MSQKNAIMSANRASHLEVWHLYKLAARALLQSCICYVAALLISDLSNSYGYTFNSSICVLACTVRVLPHSTPYPPFRVSVYTTVTVTVHILYVYCHYLYTPTAEILARMTYVVDRMHFRCHVDPWCRENCNPDKLAAMKKVKCIV